MDFPIIHFECLFIVQYSIIIVFCLLAVRFNNGNEINQSIKDDNICLNFQKIFSNNPI